MISTTHITLSNSSCLFFSIGSSPEDWCRVDMWNFGNQVSKGPSFKWAPKISFYLIKVDQKMHNLALLFFFFRVPIQIPPLHLKVGLQLVFTRNQEAAFNIARTAQIYILIRLTTEFYLPQLKNYIMKPEESNFWLPDALQLEISHSFLLTWLSFHYWHGRVRMKC